MAKYRKLPSYTHNFHKVYECDDCGCAPDAPMIEHSVWLSIATRKTLLCIGCTEERLGRPLTVDDLTNCPMNGPALYIMERMNNGSPRD